MQFTEEKITADIHGVYVDRKPKNNMTICWDDLDPEDIQFRVNVSDKREDDDIIISVNLADLLYTIGKTIKRDDHHE
jgi:metal-dependent HD superfamily phosphatase/phosphodiesterase